MKKRLFSAIAVALTFGVVFTSCKKEDGVTLSVEEQTKEVNKLYPYKAGDVLKTTEKSALSDDFFKTDLFIKDSVINGITYQAFEEKAGIISDARFFFTRQDANKIYGRELFSNVTSKEEFILYKYGKRDEEWSIELDEEKIDSKNTSTNSTITVNDVEYKKVITVEHVVSIDLILGYSEWATYVVYFSEENGIIKIDQTKGPFAKPFMMFSSYTKAIEE